MRVHRPLTVLLVTALATLLAAGPAPAAPGVVRYAAPAPGEVLVAFDPPASMFGAGHRGVDLAAAPGDVVRSAADGRVVFAGPVAGTSWVSILHADGVTTSYGPLTGLQVGLGQDVTRSQVLARLAAGGHGDLGLDSGLHWGARIGARYVDPLGLLEAGVPRPSLIGAGTWSGSAHAVTPYDPWSGGRFWGLGTSGSPVAERPGFAYAPNPNHLVLVPGLATTSDSRVLDPGHLGYDPRSVTRFSYAGRRDQPGDATDPQRDQLPYAYEDTWEGSQRAAAALAEQLRAQARREPGRAVDLIGHSMGGIVILTYLLEHHDPYDVTLPPIGHVVTIASPIDGSDTAAVGDVVRGTPLVGAGIGLLQDRGLLGGDRLPLDAPAVAELSVGSESLWALAVAWEQAIEAGTAGALATGTRVLNVGGSRDMVVSSARTRQPDTLFHDGVPHDLGIDRETGASVELPPGFRTRNGATAEIDGRRVVDHRVLPGGHMSVLETEALREVTWRFLAGEEVVESPGRLSRHVGGELADNVRLAAEIASFYGPVAKVARNPERVLDIDRAPPVDGSGD